MLMWQQAWDDFSGVLMPMDNLKLANEEEKAMAEKAK